MGVTVRQKTKGKGKPWWVFISHDGKRASRRVGDKQAAEDNSALRKKGKDRFRYLSIVLRHGLKSRYRLPARNRPKAIIKRF
jgi:hypothetical protein